MALRNSAQLLAAFSVLALSGIAGFVTTELVVPDIASKFSGDEISAAQTALQSATRCLENPLQRLTIQKFDVRFLEREEIAAHPTLPKRTDRIALSRTLALRGSDAADSAALFRAEVVAYTWFAVPVSTIAVHGSGLDTPGDCSRK